jgi:hypothetical protein
MLNRAWACAGRLILGAWLLSQPATAQNPATVAIRAELVAPRYRERFVDRRAVETKVANLFADYLTRNVGFLRFAVNDSTLPYRLSFLLDRLDRGATSNFAEFGFWVRLDRPGDVPVESYWLQLRTVDQSAIGVGTEVGFLTEIKSKLAHQDADSLRNGILRWVPITETGLPNLNPLGLVLPFRLLDLCMKNQSVVQFLAEIRGTVTMEVPFKAQIVGNFVPQGPQPPDIEPFFGGGFGKVIDLTLPDELTPSIAQKAVTVKKIFVTSYVHDPTACDNRAPRAVGGGVTP